MARTSGYMDGAGIMKMPEYDWDFTDGLTFSVLTGVDTTTISGGDFSLQTAATLTGWPAAGHFCVNSRVYTYGSISGDTFLTCNGPFGDLAAVAITENETGYQAVPSSLVNALMQRVDAFMVYQASDQTGLDITVNGGTMIYRGIPITVSSGAVSLYDDNYNVVYYKPGTGVTVSANGVSFYSALTAARLTAGVCIPLAFILTASGAITSCTSTAPLGGLHDEVTPYYEETFPAASGVLDTLSPQNVLVHAIYAQHPDADDAATGQVIVSDCEWATVIDGNSTGALLTSWAAIGWTAAYTTPPDHIHQDYGSFARVIPLMNNLRTGTTYKTALIGARLKVNAIARFDKIMLTLSDVDNSNTATETIQTNGSSTVLTDDTWYDYLGSDIDITDWVGPLRLTLTAYGTIDTVAGSFGASSLYLESFYIMEYDPLTIP